ncbi:MAG TPA: hypothetical protein VKA46_41750 [Gemmataceae bacterium]|nr:hypothetical protein [Gemmataceae bacterium]
MAKRDGVGFFRWILPGLDAWLRFVGWNDARTTAAATEPELTADAVCEFANSARPEEPWLFVVEFKLEPRGEDLDQLLEYVIRCRRDRRPAFDPRVKYSVGGVLIDLTGKRAADTLNMSVPGLAGVGLSFRTAHRPLATEDAAGTLMGISNGQIVRSVLPWVPLMGGADGTAAVEEWKRLADTEPNPELRREYATDARTFADLADLLERWDPMLKEFDMRESRVVREWQAEADLKRLRLDVLRALERRCKAPVPADITQSVQATTDVDSLSRWFDAAIDASSYDDFRAALKS